MNFCSLLRKYFVDMNGFVYKYFVIWVPIHTCLLYQWHFSKSQPPSHKKRFCKIASESAGWIGLQDLESEVTASRPTTVSAMMPALVLLLTACCSIFSGDGRDIGCRVLSIFFLFFHLFVKRLFSRLFCLGTLRTPFSPNTSKILRRSFTCCRENLALTTGGPGGHNWIKKTFFAWIVLLKVFNCRLSFLFESAGRRIFVWQLAPKNINFVQWSRCLYRRIWFAVLPKYFAFVSPLSSSALVLNDIAFDDMRRMSSPQRCVWWQKSFPLQRLQGSRGLIP